MGKKHVKTNVKHELAQVKEPVSFTKLTGNNKFCSNFVNKFSMTVLPTESSEENVSTKSLVYSVPSVSDFDSEGAFGVIIDLLNQLKAATSDQNIFVQNNTVLRDQIVHQLKNEVLKARTNLTSNQIKNLEVISSNNFDEKTLTDILKSLLESAKKKSDEKSSLIYKVKPGEGSRTRSLPQKIAEDYFKILKNVHHYSKTVEDVFNHVSYKKSIHNSSESVSGESGSDAQIKPQAQKKTIDKKHIQKSVNEILNTNVIEEIQESFEKNILNKINTLSPIVKLQSKISELSVISNVTKLVNQVVERSVPKVLKTHTKLINKIVDKSEIEELKENIISHENQYKIDRDIHQRSLDRMYSDIRKVYNTKTFSQNIFEVLKSSKFKNVHFEEAIKKNLLKVTAKNEVVNKIKNIYEKQIEKSNVNRTVDKSEIINKENVEVLDTEERSAIDDIVNLKRTGHKIETRFNKTTNIVDKILNDVKFKNTNYKTVLENIDLISNKSHEEKEILKRIFVSHFINSENADIISKTKKIDKFLQKHQNLISVNKDYQITENDFEFSPVYLKDKVIKSAETEAIIENNIKKVLTPTVITNNVIKTTTKDIYRNIITPKMKEYIKTDEISKNVYLIHKNIDVPIERKLDYLSTPYMVYKEEPNFVQNEINDQKSEPQKQKFTEIKNENPQIEQIVQDERIDVKKLKKEMMAKTISKDDVESMINSHLKEINIESISKEVIGRVENKLRLDRRRSGIL